MIFCNFREFLGILHGPDCDIKSENLSSPVKNLIHSFRINIFEDLNESCINNSDHSESIDVATIDVARNNVEDGAKEVCKLYIDVVKETSKEAVKPNNVVNNEATDISDTFDTFFKAVEIQNRNLICK